MATNGSTNGDADPVKAAVNGFFKDIASQLNRVPQDLSVVHSFIEAAFSSGLVNDKKFLLEGIIQAVATLPNGSSNATLLTSKLLGNLWDNLKHPPLSYMGDTFKYRAADGSNNNLLYPDLGKSGSFYARSVVPQRPLQTPLPDPATIFDEIFARDGPAREHPAKFSSLAIALATIIIHDIFRTDDRDWNKVASSSYLDLGPLYGHNADQQATVRTFKNGFLKPDTFAEPRMLGQPPGVAALLITFNRFHNYVVQQLAVINENGRFSMPVDKEDDVAALAKRDNDLFQTGRLVTCGLYVNIILKDYVRVILNLNRSETTWTLDPRLSSFDPFDSEGIPKGIGNQVSIEFNLIYRWHATISDKNAKWVEDFFQKIFPGIDPQTMTQQQFRDGMKTWGHRLDADPGKWTFGGLVRNERGGFDDASLINLLTEETEDVAGAFGARNIPAIMKAIDVLGMEQGRAWGAASLNEVRKFFQLQPHKTFLDINSDPDVAASLEALYTHPDNVELYPGLNAEEAKPTMAPGSGLCSGYTTSKAILSDAVALVRGDRFYSVDSSPANLTNFGFNEIASDPNVGGGVVIRKLLMRAFPGWYRGDSVYALFPLTVPEENRVILRAMGKENNYTFDRPSFINPPTPINTWQANADILSDRVNYKVPWGPHIFDLLGREYMLGWDNEASIKQHKLVASALYSPLKGMAEVRSYYERTITELFHKNSNKLRASYQLDAVRDATNLSHANFIANLFHIPIKTETFQSGITAQELFDKLRTIFAYVSLDLDETKSFALKARAKQAVVDLAAIYRPVVEAVKEERFHHLKELLGIGVGAMPVYGTEFIRRLLEEGMSIDEVVWTAIPLAAEASFQGQGSAQMIDLFLSDKYKSHWGNIQKLSSDDSPEAFNQLRKYALEAYRLTAPALTLRDVGLETATIKDGAKELHLKKGDRLLMNFMAAGADPSKYPDPQEIKLDRPEQDYIVFGYGSHSCVGREIVVTAMAAQLRAFGKLKNFRRAPGQAGMLKMVLGGGVFKLYMNDTWSDWTPYPGSLKVCFDEF